MVIMLNIEKNLNESKLTVSLSGRLDTTSAPNLESELQTAIDGVETLVLDMSELVYISSAGLRVILSAQKVMNKQGEMIVRGVNSDVMEIFEVTGFVDILNIQE